MKDQQTFPGQVIEALPQTQFIVQLSEGKTFRCALSGKMFKNHIRVTPGDRVDIVVSGTMGRIVKRK